MDRQGKKRRKFRNGNNSMFLSEQSSFLEGADNSDSESAIEDRLLCSTSGTGWLNQKGDTFRASRSCASRYSVNTAAEQVRMPKRRDDGRKRANFYQLTLNDANKMYTPISPVNPHHLFVT